MKKVFGWGSVILGSILALLGLAFVVYYGFNWTRFCLLTGTYYLNVYLIYVAVLVVGCVLVWFGKTRLLVSRGRRYERDS